MSTTLFHGKRLARNVVWNLVGAVVPLTVAIAAIPLLVAGLGTDRFGVLTLAWVVVGYFSLFDMGLGRALTMLTGEKLGRDQESEIAPLAWTAMSMMGVLGLVGGAVLAMVTPWIVKGILTLPAALEGEVLVAFYILSLSLPFVTSGAGLRGLLEAYQRFGLANAIRIPLGVFTFAGPLLVLPWTHNLGAVIGILVVGRILAWVVNLIFCLRVVMGLREGVQFHRDFMRPLLSFGGWMTLSNLIGPFMVYIDRFMIGAMVSIVAVAYYTTPYEVVTKLWVVPGAIVGVLFPALSYTLVQDRKRAARLYGRSLNYVFFGMFPLVLILVVFARQVLDIWLGQEFADNSAFVLQWIAIGVLFNSIEQVVYALILGAGRPRLVTRFQLLELPLYLPLLWWVIDGYGIKGAAVAWCLRIALETVVLARMADGLMPEARAHIRRIGGWSIGALLVLLLCTIIPGFGEKMFAVLVALSGFAILGWRMLLVEEDRIWVKNLIMPQRL